MPINITKRNPTTEEKEVRVITGLQSFDWAFADNLGNRGLPLRSFFEIAGSKGVGKSTVMFSLAGIVAKQLKRDILLLDFERQNESTVSSCLEGAGFSGDVDWTTFVWEEGKKKKSMTSEEILDLSTSRAYEPLPPIMMVDSIAAWRPTSTYEGDLGAANMGTKAKILRQWFDRTLKPVISNPEPTVVFFTNHKMQIIGGFRPGPNAPVPTESAGGTAVGYFATQSIDLRKVFGHDYPEQGGWVAEGKVSKNRDGYGIESKKSFYLYVQAGEGINKNLTAVIDCVMYGLAESSGKNVTEGATISMDGVKYSKFREMIADRHNDDVFLPFHNALKSINGAIKEVEAKIGGDE